MLLTVGYVYRIFVEEEERKEKKKQKRKENREIASIASMHMCITTQICSSLPDFTTFWSPSYSGLCQLKITLFTPLQWAY
jgi:hypothetical protein